MTFTRPTLCLAALLLSITSISSSALADDYYRGQSWSNSWQSGPGGFQSQWSQGSQALNRRMVQGPNGPRLIVDGRDTFDSSYRGRVGNQNFGGGGGYNRQFGGQYPAGMPTPGGYGPMGQIGNPIGPVQFGPQGAPPAPRMMRVGFGQPFMPTPQRPMAPPTYLPYGFSN